MLVADVIVITGIKQILIITIIIISDLMTMTGPSTYIKHHKRTGQTENTHHRLLPKIIDRMDFTLDTYSTEYSWQAFYMFTCSPSQPLHDLRKCVTGMPDGRMSARAIAWALVINNSIISRSRLRFEELTRQKTVHMLDDLLWQPLRRAVISGFSISSIASPATGNSHETVGLLNRRISPQTFRKQLRKVSVHTRALDVD